MVSALVHEECGSLFGVLDIAISDWIPRLVQDVVFVIGVGGQGLKLKFIMWQHHPIHSGDTCAMNDRVASPFQDQVKVEWRLAHHLLHLEEDVRSW